MPGQELLKKARAAKKEAIKRFGEEKHVCGFGIARRDGKYVVKINFTKSPSNQTRIPETLKGVTVVCDIVGEIKKQGTSTSLKASTAKPGIAATKSSSSSKSKKIASKKAASNKAAAKKRKGITKKDHSKKS